MKKPTMSRGVKLLLFAFGVALFALAPMALPPLQVDFVDSLATLAKTPRTAAPAGVWRLDYAIGAGAGALYFSAQQGSCTSHTMANDGASCVDGPNGDSWLGQFGKKIDARQFGWSATAAASANQASLQKAMTAAAVTGQPTTVVIPSASANAPIYWPSYVSIEGFGLDAKITKANDGPLFVSVAYPGTPYQIGSWGHNCTNLAVDNNNKAGAGFQLLYDENSQFHNCSSQNSKQGAVFSVSGISNGVMTVSAITRGTIAPGDMVLCDLCSQVLGVTNAAQASGTTISFSTLPAGVIKGAVVKDVTTPGAIPSHTFVNSIAGGILTLSATVTGVGNGDTISFNTNTWPIIEPYGTSGTGGSGSTGTYKLSTNASGISAEAAWTATPYTMTIGPNFGDGTSPGDCGDGGPCQVMSHPTADVSLLGTVLGTGWRGGWVGGSYYGLNDESDCGQVSAQGFYFNSIQTDGLNRPNHNNFENIYNVCTVGVSMANGADNLFSGLDHEYDTLGEAYGFGYPGTWRMVVKNSYFEGSSIYPMLLEVLWGTQSGPDYNERSTVTGLGGQANLAGLVENHNLAIPNAVMQAPLGYTPKTSYTPTITCATGAVGTYHTQSGTFSVHDSTAFVQMDVQADIGTCSGTIQLSLPLSVLAPSTQRQTCSAIDYTAADPRLWSGTSSTNQLQLYKSSGNPTGSDEFVVSCALTL